MLLRPVDPSVPDYQLLSVFAKALDDTSAFVLAAYDSRNPAYAAAEGIQLDSLGESAGIPRREGWDDETYRGVLLRKLKLWTWDGTNESSFLYLSEEWFPVPVGIKAMQGS